MKTNNYWRRTVTVRAAFTLIFDERTLAGRHREPMLARGIHHHDFRYC